MANIVVLDGYTVNPGDLSWEPLHALGTCTIHDRTPAAEIVSRALQAEIVLTNKTPLSRETMLQLPSLRYIGVLATGYNIVDVAAAHERGIVVTNVPAYSTQSVAQHVFALLLEATHHTGAHNDLVHSGAWVSSADFSFQKFPLIELSGKTMGIVGFGNIGRAVARIAEAFGMRILASTRTIPQTTGDVNVKFTDVDSVFRDSDVVTLHCPLTPGTSGLVNAHRLSLMKPSAILINTSRGPVIDEQALADALQSGMLAAAAVDVLSSEPPKPDNPLLTAPRCIITPHFAWATGAARARLLTTVIENVQGFLRGVPINTVA